MGLSKAVSDATGGVLGDQWKDFYTVPDGLRPTAALFAAVRRDTNAGRGANTWGSAGVISNGSRFVVPEGIEDGIKPGVTADQAAELRGVKRRIRKLEQRTRSFVALRRTCPRRICHCLDAPHMPAGARRLNGLE